MHEIIEKAQRAVEEPEVQKMCQELSKYGLGVFVPHMHDETGDFAPLTGATVQVENDLVVSFHSESDPSIQNAIPVGWRWDESTKSVMRCSRCYKGHHT